jgi:uncharacterized protein
VRKNRLLSMLVLTLSLGLFTVGCGSSPNQSNTTADQKQSGEKNTEKTEAKKGEKPDSIIIATGGTSGTYYPLGGGLAQIFTEKAKINSSAQSTGASVENMRLLKDGQVDLAFTQGDIADYASKGAVMFKDTGAIKNLRAIASLYNETVQIVVPKDSPIKSVQDLKGKRVSVGAPGSGTEANALQMLEIYGLKFEDLGKAEHLDFGESSNHLKDGNIDAAFVTAGTPTAAVNELAATKGVNIVGMDDEHIKQLIAKYPYYAEQPIPIGTYPGFEQDVKTVAVKAQLVVRAELDETMVYNLTKALYENLDQMQKVHKKAEQIKLETALEGVSLELHPGAAKYFAEKGIKK